jgi:ankyrin repeat protein
MPRCVFNLLLLLCLLPVSCRSLQSRNQDLMQAARKADAEGVALALGAGASPNAVQYQNETALGLLLNQYKRSHEDKRQRIEAAVTLLLEHGADANALHHGFTPLLIATGQGCDTLVLRLLAYGADPNLETRAALAPIWQAVIDNNYQIGLILLQNGANPNAKGLNQETPLQYLQSNGYQKSRLMHYLRQHGGH